MRDRVAWLDGVRALACLAVMAFHAQVPGFGHGYLGVDVFFVLSGFLAASQLGDGRSAGRWLFRRWARLHPALLVLVLLVGPLAVLGGASPGGTVAVAVFVYSPWFLGADGGLLGHTWSIMVEVVAYAVAAALLPFVLRFHRRFVAALLVVLAVAAVVAPWAAVRLVRPEGILVGWALGALYQREFPRAVTAVARPLGHPTLTAVGGRTYSLYLWHLPVFQLLKFHTPVTGVTLTLLQFGVAFVAAELSFRFVEAPTRRWLYRWGDTRLFARRPSGVVGAAAR